MKFRSLLFAIALVLAPFSAAFAQNAPTYTTPTGQTASAQGVVIVSPDGTLASQGCVYNTTPPTYTNGQKTVCQAGSRGSQNVTLMSADGAASPTIATVSVDGASSGTVAVATRDHNYVWNNTTWDRQRGDTTGTWAVGNIAHDGVDAGNPVKIGGYAAATAPTAVADGDRANLWTNPNGALVVAAGAYDGGSGGDGRGLFGFPSRTSGALTPNPVAVGGFVYNGSTWDRAKKPNAASRIPSSAATTNATVAKASAGDVFRVNGNNASGAVKYLKFYNKATAPTVGTDTPVLTLALPPGAFSFDLGSFYFSTGIAYALTGGAADADTTALAAGDILGLNVVYQ